MPTHEEEFVGEVRAKQEKYFDIQIPSNVAKVMKLTKGTLVRVKIKTIEAGEAPGTP